MKNLKIVSALEKARMSVADNVNVSNGIDLNITVTVKSTMDKSERERAMMIANKIIEALKTL